MRVDILILINNLSLRSTLDLINLKNTWYEETLDQSMGSRHHIFLENMMTYIHA